MADQRKHLLVVERDQDAGPLLTALLEDEGYRATWVRRSLRSFTEIRHFRPDLVVLSARPGSQDRQLLDGLRGDSVTATFPIVALTGNEPDAELLGANYNVRAAVSGPFSRARLISAVHQALDEPPLHAETADEEPPEMLLLLAERALARGSREVLLAWLLQLRQEEPWSSRDDLNLGDVLDLMPVIIEAITLALRFGNADRYLQEHPEAIERVQRHTQLRRRQSIPLGAVVHEYTVLREEIWRLLWEALPKKLPAERLAILERVVNHTLDRIVEETIPAYLG